METVRVDGKGRVTIPRRLRAGAMSEFVALGGR